MPVFFTYPDANNPDPNVNYNTGLMGGMSYNQAQAILNTPSPSFGSQLADVAKAAAQTVGDVGNQIDQSVNDTIPGGWATVGAAALAAATYGGSLAGEGLAAAPELDATGSMAEQAAASQAASAGAGAGLTDTGLSMIPPETPIPDYTPTYDYSPTTVVTNASPELDATGSLPQQALQTPVIVAPEITPNITPNITPDIAPQDLANALRSEGTAQLGSGTSLSADATTDPLNPYYSVANPEVQANLGTVSNLVGGGAESNLATLDSLNNPLLPTSGAGIGGSELGATGSIIGSGQGLGVQTLPETLAPTGLNGLTVNDLNSQPLLNNGTSSSITSKDVADALRAANSANNLIKSLTSSQQQLAKNQQNLQQSQALANMLKATQGQQTALPAVYKQGNPFSYAPQESINNNMASLLRNNYGNS